MSEESGRIGRPVVAELEEILGVPLKVLDDGFVRVVDYMGADESIVQAARVSYGSGTRKLHEDRGLIRYLMRHWHTTPFEMCELKLHVRVPMDCWRQWIRHRTACLAEGTSVRFDREDPAAPSGFSRFELPIEEVWRRVRCARDEEGAADGEPVALGEGGRALHLRQIDEDSLRIGHVGVVDAYRNGPKPVFAMILADGKRIEATRDHRFFFADGWHTLAEAFGLEEKDGRARWRSGVRYVHVNGRTAEAWEFAPDGDAAAPSGRRAKLTPVEVAKLVRVERFEYVGVKETYDLEVAGPFHNFLAAGIVTHNSVNEYSTRYSIAIDASQRTAETEWRAQSTGNRQGSEGSLDPVQGRMLSARESELQDFAREVYQERLDLGVAREQARKDLPLSTYTEAYWKVDLHNLFHFLRLRMDEHAQLEIRDYARTIGEKIVAKWCPIAWEAFLDYQVRALGLTRLEQEIVQAVTAADRDRAIALATGFGWLERGDKGLKTNRERSECEDKLAGLGLAAPWKE